MDNEILDMLKHKKEVYRGGSKDRGPEHNTETLSMWIMIGFEKLKALVKLNMARNIKANKKSFRRYVSIKEQAGKRWCLSGGKWETW